ncbi:MAG TPA: Uma2 family endonuclease [Vicinamibacteria bacterium]
MSVGPTSVETTALLPESPRLLSVDEYHRMIEAGILDEDERVELLEGVIVASPPQSPAHAHCILWLSRLLIRRLGEEHVVGVRTPLTLGARSEPEPDLSVVRADSVSRERHPGTAVLVIEVAHDSLRRDRRVKGALYARHGVPEYWIVNLEERVVEVFLEPDTTSGTYRRSRTVTTAETLASEALPEISFPVAELFG